LDDINLFSLAIQRLRILLDTLIGATCVRSGARAGARASGSTFIGASRERCILFREQSFSLGGFPRGFEA